MTPQTPAPTAKGLRGKYLAVLCNPSFRQVVHDEAHRRLSKNQCALTQYLFLVKAGVLRPVSPVPTFTYQVEHLLWAQVKGLKRIVDRLKLLPGDVLFSQNRNDKPGADHVYGFVDYWPDSGHLEAKVVDNYAVGPHKRNLIWIAPYKTPFDFALRLPN